MKLDVVQDNFRGRPNNLTAGLYLKCVLEYERDAILDREGVIDCLRELRNWLMLGEVLPRTVTDAESVLRFRQYQRPDFQ